MSDVRGQGLFFGPLHGLLFKNSRHVIIFLWLCGLQNTDHVMPFGCSRPRPLKRKPRVEEMLKTKTGRSYIPAKALSEDIRRGIKNTIVQNGGDHLFFLEAAALMLQGNLM